MKWLGEICVCIYWRFLDKDLLPDTGLYVYGVKVFNYVTM